MKFFYNDIEIKVTDVSDKIDTWIVKKSETISYNLKEVVISAFEKDFPNIKLSGIDDDSKYEFLTKLLARNRSLTEWYSNQKLIYSDIAQMPSYTEDLISPKKFKQVQESLTKINKSISEFVKLREKANREYKLELDRIQKLEDLKIDEIKGDDNVIKILSISSSQLPLSLALNIENFKPTGDEEQIEETRKLYIREVLTQFKISLLKLVKDNPKIDINDIISELSLK